MTIAIDMGVDWYVIADEYHLTLREERGEGREREREKEREGERERVKE